MRSRLHACGMLLLLGAAAVAQAAEDGVALETTRQELRQLEKDQKSRAGQGASPAATIDAPSIQLQAPGADSPQQWLSEKLKKERRQKDEKLQKNWLVDGVQKLGTEQSGVAAQSDATKTTGSEATTGVVDTSDPEYLLKLFDEQKSSAAKDAKPAAGKGHVAAPDAFAPFLQDWLGSSPVRGQFFDQFVKPVESTGGPAVTTGGSEFRSTAAGLEPSTNRVPATKPNPYLAALDAPVLKEFPADGPATTLAPLSTLAPDLGRPAAATSMPDPLPDTKPAAKGPPPSWVDDKKYFPQLKKF